MECYVNEKKPISSIHMHFCGSIKVHGAEVAPDKFSMDPVQLTGPQAPKFTSASLSVLTVSLLREILKL